MLGSRFSRSVFYTGSSRFTIGMAHLLLPTATFFFIIGRNLSKKKKIQSYLYSSLTSSLTLRLDTTYDLRGVTSIYICIGLREFLGHGVFGTKTRKVLG